MTVRLSASICLLFAIPVLALPGTGRTQDNTTPDSHAATTVQGSNAAPVFDSTSNTDTVSSTGAGMPESSGFNTPEDDGRPGEYFFAKGAYAVKHKDYAFAIDMYKVAASWAYKPAEYNLGVMYLSGQGTPVDLPRAMAWMALAAERKDPQYLKALAVINAHLTPAQFAQANVVLGELAPTYSDAVALRRAKARWRDVRNSATGSRVGSAASPVQVGGVAGVPAHMQSPNYDVHDGGHVAATGAELAGTHQTDGALAYQQLRASDNPYDPKFEWRPGSTGKVTVEPLVPVKKSDVQNPAASGTAPTPSH